MGGIEPPSMQGMWMSLQRIVCLEIFDNCTRQTNKEVHCRNSLERRTAWEWVLCWNLMDNIRNPVSDIVDRMPLRRPFAREARQDPVHTRCRVYLGVNGSEVVCRVKRRNDCLRFLCDSICTYWLRRFYESSRLVFAQTHTVTRRSRSSPRNTRSVCWIQPHFHHTLLCVRGE